MDKDTKYALGLAARKITGCMPMFIAMLHVSVHAISMSTMPECQQKA
jgi:hypothetical protein